jgi:3D-(3,5/4)-trihydroxycyclohexane-1,2-dione acylhydrolase (decyclizing)
MKVDYSRLGNCIPGLLALDGGCTQAAFKEALEQAGNHPGLSLIHLPVYYGPNPLGGMGVYGRWNVGGWCDDVQAMRHEIGL